MSDFQRILGTALAWVHFDNDVKYQGLRELESKLVIDIVRIGGISAVDAYKVVRPKLDFPSSIADGRPASRVLLAEVARVVEPGVAGYIFARMCGSSGMSEICQNENAVLKAVLLDPDSSLYCQPLKGHFDALPARAKTSRLVQENCIDLTFHLASMLERPNSTGEYDRVRAVATKCGLATIAWEGATAQPLQPRTQGSLNHSREIIEQKTGKRLRLPGWWSNYEGYVAGDDLAHAEQEVAAE